MYEHLTAEWTPRFPNRPHTAINMIATIDGKILSGERGEPVQDLGSETDHRTMRQLQGAAQAVLIGGGSQRSSKKITYPPHLHRFVATSSGALDFDSRFFLDDPFKVTVICPLECKLIGMPPGVSILRTGAGGVDWVSALSQVRADLGVERLLIEGGSNVNGQLLRLNLIDELFLTIAPKVRLGEHVPTYAGGEPLARNEIQNYTLVSANKLGDEMYVRYRRIWF